MKKQNWVHDRATDAWQALRIHGEFIKGFDELFDRAQSYFLWEGF